LRPRQGGHRWSRRCGLALEHAEHQAARHRDRRIESKRLPKEEKAMPRLR